MLKSLILAFGAVAALGATTVSVKLFWPTTPNPTRIASILPNRIICVVASKKGSLALDIPLSDNDAVGYDSAAAFMPLIVEGGATPGAAPANIPSLTIIQTGKRRHLVHYELTTRVKKFSVRVKNADDVELRVANERPYRVELWLQSDNEVTLDVEIVRDETEQTK